MEHILQALEPFKESMEGVVVESTYNRYWMVDGFQEEGYKVYLINPTCDDKVLQGVTTDVIGNCGFSAAPLSEEFRADITDALAIVGAQHLPKADLEHYSFDDYLRRLEAVRPGINVIPLVGHSTVRITVLGSANRAPREGPEALEIFTPITW